MGLILDTSVLIRAERKGLADPLKDLAPDTISVITVSELLVGLNRASKEFRARREGFIAGLIDELEIFPMTLEIAHVHARLAADLAVRGLTIGAHDLIIAATALHLGWAVKTGNEREFRRVDGLKVLPL
jgi:tRNA(fMet)-specific endonuclease VapC